MIGSFLRNASGAVVFRARHVVWRHEMQTDTFRAGKLAPIQETTLMGCAVEVVEDETAPCRYDFAPYFGSFDPVVEGQLTKIFKPLAALSSLLRVRSKHASKARYKLTIVSNGAIHPSVLEVLLAQSGGRFEDLEGCVLGRITEVEHGLLEPGSLVKLRSDKDGKSYETTLEALHGGFALLEASRPPADVGDANAAKTTLSDVVDGDEFILRRSAPNRLPIGNRSGVLFDVWRGQVAGNWHNLVKMIAAPSTLEEPSPSEADVALVEKIIEESNLDPDQRQAVIGAALTPHMHVIQGPPGCGKTTVIAEIVRVLQGLGKTVLVVGPTHSATDEVIRKLKKIKGPEIHRLGGVSESIARDTLSTRLAARRTRYEKVIIGAGKKFGNVSPEIAQLEHFISMVEDSLAALPHYHLLDGRVEDARRRPLDLDGYREGLRSNLAEADRDLAVLQAKKTESQQKITEIESQLRQMPTVQAKSVPMKVSPDIRGHNKRSQSPLVPSTAKNADLQRAARQAALKTNQKVLLSLETDIETLLKRRETDQSSLDDPAIVLDDLSKERHKKVEEACAERDAAFPTCPFSETRAWTLADVFRAASTDTGILPAARSHKTYADPQDWIGTFMTEWRAGRLPRDEELRTIIDAFHGYLPHLKKREALLLATLAARRKAKLICKSLFAERQIDCATIYAHKAANSTEAENVYDVIIADEASKITEADFVNVAPLARRWIFVGDTRQLPPYVGRADLTFVLGAFSKYFADNVLPGSALLKSIRDERESLQGLSKIFVQGAKVEPEEIEDGDDFDSNESFLSRYQGDAEISDTEIDSSWHDGSEDVDIALEPAVSEKHLEDAAFLLALLWNQRPDRPKVDEAAIIRAVGQLDDGDWDSYWKPLKGYIDSFRVDSLDAAAIEKNMVLGCERALDAVDRFLVRGLLDRFMTPDSGDMPAGLVTQLSGQRRMTETLANIVRGPVYKGQYHTASTVSPLTLEQDFTKSMTFLDTSIAGHYAGEEEVGTSYRNVLEANWFLSALATYDEELAKTGERVTALGLSFYKAQVEHIDAQIRRKRFKNVDWHGIGTVDSYQGQEADLVLISVCRTGIAAGVRGRFSKWLQDVRRLNVAFTRARRGLVIIGHAPTLEDLCGSRDAMDFYENLFRFLRDPESDAELRLGGPHGLYDTERQMAV